MPMLVALLVCTVTFPALARSVAAGEAEAARRRLEADLRTVTALIFVAAAFLVVFAPQVVGVLLEHGAFTAGRHRGDRGDHAGVRARAARARHGRRAVPAVLHRRAADLVPGRRRWAPGWSSPRCSPSLAVPLFGVTGDRRRQRRRHHRHRRAAAGRAAPPRSIAVSLAAVGASGPRWPACAAGAGAAGWLAGRLLAGAGRRRRRRRRRRRAGRLRRAGPARRVRRGRRHGLATEAEDPPWH